MLLCKCKKFDLKPKLLCQLFDVFVGSILGHASEIWEYTKSKEIERIHLKFCKRIHNVKTNSCSSAVYGELGRFPLYIYRHVRIIKYWCKLRTRDNIILKTLYTQSIIDCNNDYKNWVSNVKTLLNKYGFGYVFNDECFFQF